MLMGWPPKINCPEVDTLVKDFWAIIEKRHATNDATICALEMVKTRIIASEAMIVKENSER